MKKKWSVTQIKRANWTPVPVSQLTEKSFWANVDEESLANDSLVEGLQRKFSMRRPTKDPGGTKKRVAELKFLDNNAARNLSIIRGGALKNKSVEQIRNSILQCDSDILTENVLQIFLKYITKEVLEMIQKKSESEEFVNLAVSEELVWRISSIGR